MVKKRLSLSSPRYIARLREIRDSMSDVLAQSLYTTNPIVAITIIKFLWQLPKNYYCGIAK